MVPGRQGSRVWEFNAEVIPQVTVAVEQYTEYYDRYKVSL